MPPQSSSPELKPLRTKHDPRSPGITYQLEYVLCGKAKCRKLHGPYWYAYWKVEQHMRKRYVGKKFHVIDRIPVAALELEPVLGNRAASPRGRLPKTGPRPAKPRK